MRFASASFLLPFLLLDLAKTMNCNSVLFAKLILSTYGKTSKLSFVKLFGSSEIIKVNALNYMPNEMSEIQMFANVFKGFRNGILS